MSVNPVDCKIRRGGDAGPGAGPRVRRRWNRRRGRATRSPCSSQATRSGTPATSARPGTNSELHLVDERIVGRKPTTLSFADAAALPLTAITAWEGLFDKLKLTGESRGTLFVPGASGGVGSMVLQLAEALLPGVRVIATSSRPETDEWVRDLGAEAWVNHRAGDLRGQLAARGS